MQNPNLFGLFLATLVAPELKKIDEELHSILERVGPTITAAVMAFFAQSISGQSTFEFEKELERHLREIGRQIMEAVLNRLEPEDPEGMPKHFAQQQQEYSRKQEKSNNRGGTGTCFGTIPLRRFCCEPLRRDRVRL